MDEFVPMMDHGWCLMSDLFSDVQPDPVLMFSADDLNPANLSAISLPPFTCPREAFICSNSSSEGSASCESITSSTSSSVISSKPSPLTVWGESKRLGRGGRMHPPGPTGDSNGEQIVQSRVKVVLGEMWYILPIRVYARFVFGEFVFGKV
ncbi:hypothetical protein E2C01_030328 [Portunus trituberculatus]|uniref:Uncharacterized protein n=1 Tax=Portunus trituberculatus TaxID=210409 RepID=A0A5B7EQK5_PORTR|nr:hypothetical protein [Portunus trituberculatus]